MTARWRAWWPEAALLAAMVAWRGLWLARDAFPLHGDEAVVLLMARHILRGARPVFFYGQAYMGSLDAYLVAGAFALFGESLAVARGVQVALYGLLLALTAWGVRRAWGPRVARWVLLYLAVPPVLLTIYTTVTLGGYNEALLLGTAGLLWATYGLPRVHPRAVARHGLGLGVLVGLGAWVLPLSWVYLGPAGWAAWQRWRSGGRHAVVAGLAAGLAGLALGLMPVEAFVWQRGWAALMAEMPTRSYPHFMHPWWRGIPWHALSLVMVGWPAVAGLRAPWSWAWAVPLVWGGAVLLVHAGLQAAGLGRWGRRAWHDLWPAVAVVNGLLFVFTPYGGDPTGRYFLPWAHATAVVLALGLAAWPRFRARNALLAGLLLTHAAVTARVAATPGGLSPVFLPTLRADAAAQRALRDFLLEHDLTTGYTHYWVAYPLAFLSGEALRYSPRLPYHEDLRYTPRDDRIPAYTRAAACASRVAYVTSAGQRALNDRLRTALAQAGLAWREAQVGPYVVYYDLTRPIPPWDLGLSPRPQEVACGAQP